MWQHASKADSCVREKGKLEGKTINEAWAVKNEMVVGGEVIKEAG